MSLGTSGERRAKRLLFQGFGGRWYWRIYLGFPWRRGLTPRGSLECNPDVCRPCGFFRMMHGGVSAPSCCAFTHRVAFEEVSGHRGKESDTTE